ncbi:type II secretion system GspH family protein [Massilia sp. MB5]|uniref:type IV pilin protein n=1 Tax=unclassified Massilia TaxID=2609279 RepID=UPI00067BCC24|nr:MULTISPECIES: type II secretion system protein [unclassified Massilia]AKU21522.1 general secretion pathway protein GspG [Massilia sp. NR 4-1]UMR28894.1 type II secretion system GspH family protein [Massilia sp. MB5]
MRRAGGFTIIELLVTVAMVSVLATVAIPTAELMVQKSRERELRETLRTLRAAIDEYKQASDSGHIARSMGDSGYPPTLEDLLGVRDVKDPKGGMIRFLRRIPRDPLRPDLPPLRNWGLRSYASSQQNPQPGKDVFDIYSLAPGKGINGQPYREW